MIKKPASSLKFHVLLIIICGVWYGNTLTNGYALDDAMMISENTVTQKGFDGIKEHLSHSFIYGFTGEEGLDAASSHWRPLPLITYSIEIGLWGKDKPGASHAVNVLLYTAIVLLLFDFFKRWVKDDGIAFFTTLLFAIHPIHTEVVANIKGRDELLCLLFLLLSLRSLRQFVFHHKKQGFVLALVFYFLSLVSKESGVTFLAGIPLTMYFFTDLRPRKILLYTSGFLGVFVTYMALSFSVLGGPKGVADKEIMNNPFLYAQGSEAIATKLYVMLLYLKMLVWPYPLQFDYSYNQVPYVHAGNPWVWLSVTIYLALCMVALIGFRKKAIYAYAILMFLITFSISTNLIVETGGMMGERMIFIPSIFTMLLVVWAGKKALLLLSEKSQKPVLVLVLLPLAMVWGFIAIGRNKEWKNDDTLALSDIVKCPASAKVNNAAGAAYIRRSVADGEDSVNRIRLLDTALYYFRKTVGIYPRYSEAWLNMGIVYGKLGDINKAEGAWKEFEALVPGSPKLISCHGYLAQEFYRGGMQFLKNNLPDSAIPYLEKAVYYVPPNDSLRIAALYDLGGAYYLKGRYSDSYQALQQVVKANPNYKQAGLGLDACRQMLPTIKPD